MDYFELAKKITRDYVALMRVGETMIRCPDCVGTGRGGNGGGLRCDACGGTGWVRR